MHVYLRDEQVRLRMEPVSGNGLVPDDTDLVPMAFYVGANENPSFRAILPPETLEALRDILDEPVTLGLLAEEPEDDSQEIRAMVGLAVPLDGHPELLDGLEDDDEGESEPWRESVGDPDAWRGESTYDSADPSPRTALLAFAPLIRIKRHFPEDFGEELADLLESALSGSTRPALEARVDQLLDEI